MRYFAYRADQAFKTDAQGNNLFLFQGPFSRPYIIPSIEEKQRLHKKLTWFYRVFLTSLWVGIAIFIFGGCFLQTAVFLSVLVGASALTCVVPWLVFRHDLKALKRSDAPFGLRNFYVGMARQHSQTRLILVFILSLLLLAGEGGLLMLREGSPWVAITGILFFGLCAVASGYTVALKMKTKKRDPLRGK